MPAGAMWTCVDMERTIARGLLCEAPGSFGRADRRVEYLSAARAEDEVGATQSPSGRGDVPHGGVPIEVGPGLPPIDVTIRMSGVISCVTVGA